MKTLYIIRHAKSSWDDMTLSDIDRPLSERWKRDSKIIWKKLKEKGVCLDIIYSSPSKRAKRTIKRICEYIKYPEKEIIYEKDMYMNSLEYFLAQIISLDDKYQKVCLVWHNHSWTALAEYLLAKDIWNIVTAWVVCVKFDVDSWKEVTYWNWALEFFIYPKMYY